MEYYLFGKKTTDIKHIQKIEKRSVKCMWHLKEDELDKDFIGYFTEKGECFDNCSELGIKSWSKYNCLKNNNDLKFENFQKCLQDCLVYIDQFIKLSDNIQDINGRINNNKKDLENGFVFLDTKISGSKKKRRFKKDNKRFLTNKEIESLEFENSSLEIEMKELCKKLKIEDTLYKILYKTFDIDKSYASSFSEKHGYGKTVFLYIRFKENLEKLKQKVNDIEYNNRKNYYKEKINQKEITIFQEAYDKVYEMIKQDKNDEEKMIVKKERNITNKTKFYIDENGNRQELEDNVNQVVLTN